MERQIILYLVRSIVLLRVMSTAASILNAPSTILDTSSSIINTSSSIIGSVIDKKIEVLDTLYTPLKVARSDCYPPLGCLAITNEWYHVTSRPINLLPLSRESVRTKFYLYTRNDPNTPQEIQADSRTSISSSHFEPRRLTTYFIIHGFASSFDADWVQEIKRELLDYEDANVILVDWSRGSKPIGLPLYPVAAVNTRLVGLETVYIIEYLRDNFGLSPKDIHIIGHSLGAHTAGYVGERIKELGRITGLDPAEPFFQEMPLSVRLDRSDAQFVDVIHTDGNTILLLGYGMIQPCGHIDFYPNGGLEQPGCQLAEIPLQLITEGQLEEHRSFVGCSHGRAAFLFIESLARLNKRNDSLCHFNGYNCESNEKFLNGQCASCGKDGSECGEMGLNAINTPRSMGDRKLYFATSNAPPYCMFHYQVNVRLSENPNAKRKIEGRLKISIYGSLTTLKQENLHDSSVVMEHGTSRQFIIRSPYNVGSIDKVEVYWDQSSLTLNPATSCLLGCNKALYIGDIEVAMLSNSITSRGARDTDNRKFCSGHDGNAGIETRTSRLFDSDCSKQTY